MMSIKTLEIIENETILYDTKLGFLLSMPHEWFDMDNVSIIFVRFGLHNKNSEIALNVHIPPSFGKTAGHNTAYLTKISFVDNGFVYLTFADTTMYIDSVNGVTFRHRFKSDSSSLAVAKRGKCEQWNICKQTKDFLDYILIKLRTNHSHWNNS